MVLKYVFGYSPSQIFYLDCPFWNGVQMKINLILNIYIIWNNFLISNINSNVFIQMLYQNIYSNDNPNVFILNISIQMKKYRWFPQTHPKSLMCFMKHHFSSCIFKNAIILLVFNFVLKIFLLAILVYV